MAFKTELCWLTVPRAVHLIVCFYTVSQQCNRQYACDLNVGTQDSAYNEVTCILCVALLTNIGQSYGVGAQLPHSEREVGRKS